eukprot:1143408-Pelagomonas_calceolata.AAC.1
MQAWSSFQDQKRPVPHHFLYKREEQVVQGQRILKMLKDPGQSSLTPKGPCFLVKHLLHSSDVEI